ncbi:MAG: KpsF/GutQ family sugar-phosphate isomerase [Pseudomonadota bacterium]
MSSAARASSTSSRTPVSPGDHLATARRVLSLEAQALQDCAAVLDARFADACELILGTRGRVVTSGMGKSGHIARKIAATLASTGTPAFFVHPAEASHGDLGMVHEDDVVLALSNSGETPELGDLVTHSRRFAVPLIALVGRAPSTLAEQADTALVLPPLTEACPIGLAPTTSTTAMLAVGDALAAAVLEARGFGSAEFSRLHPGGRLGARLVRVRDIMHGGDDTPLIGLDRPMRDAIVEMTRKRLGCVGVVAGEALIGVVTDGDLRRQMERPGFFDLAVEAVMTPAPRTIDAEALAAEALAQMTGGERQVTQLFVVDPHRSGQPLGIVHLHDCLKAGVA